MPVWIILHQFAGRMDLAVQTVGAGSFGDQNAYCGSAQAAELSQEFWPVHFFRTLNFHLICGSK